MAIPWNEENAAHLYRRAAFGGTSAEIAQAVRDGLEGAVEKLIDYSATSNADLDRRIDNEHFYLLADGKLSDLARWWLLRMIYTARPLEERVTLLWHDHFATAYTKVLHIGWLKGENETLRSQGFGTFRSLITAVAQDPAMQYWLDQYISTRTNPNENFGREFLELFTLGVGNYAESDVLATAKSFTGWSTNGTTSTFLFNPDEHDFGPKTFLGRTGNWDGNDIIRMTCSELAHGRRIAAKVFSYFAYDNPEPEVVDRFARIYLDADTFLPALVRAILTSPEMYSPTALWGKVKSPIDHAVMASRQLLLTEDVPATFNYLTQGGQTPFDPPDVSGWPGGVSWISPGALLNRMNFADAATRAFDPARFTDGDNVATPEAMVDVYLRRLGPVPVPAETRATLIHYFAPDGGMPSGRTSMTRQRGLARLILSLPEWQMY